jgi:putative ABC transport system permease protein
MLALRDNLSQSFDSLRAHKLRAVLTTIGLIMGVATLITVMTIVQGANLYVEQKIANLGKDVFQIARTPFVVTDLNVIIKALKNKRIQLPDVRAVAQGCTACQYVGASASTSVRVRYADQELQDVNLIGNTASMSEIDTRTVEQGRYFTDQEDQRSAFVCLVGDGIVQSFLGGAAATAVGQVIRVQNYEFTIVGTLEKVGSVLGQDQDTFVVVPLDTFLRIRGSRNSLTISVKASGGNLVFERAMDQARLVMRARRHITAYKDEDFFFGTKDSYIALWQSISSAFFAVFVMVSAISALVGGIVIMNVMLVSVTERTKEIGIRRAVGAGQGDILKQFLSESVIQCLVGGFIGVGAGFACAVALRTFTEFPASVETWVAVLGLALSSLIGLFFGIYPAVRASKLDPVVALRAD